MGGYLAGATSARVGDEMSGPALLLVGLAATGSVTTASVLLTALTATAALGGPVLGALLDRSARPGRVLALTLAGYATGLAIVLTSVGHLPVAVVALVAALTGLLNPAVAGGWTAQLPRVVPSERFGRANGLDALTFGAASPAGPALAGLVATAAGAPTAMIVAIVAVAASAPAAIRLPPPGAQRGKRGVLRTELATGFRAIVTNRPLLRATSTSMVSFAGVGMFIVCAPLLGEQRFGSANTGALLLAALAAAAVSANAVLARKPGLLRPGTMLLGSTVLLCAGLLLTALTTSPVIVVGAVLLAGIGEGPQLTALFAIRHQHAPDGMRAQIFTTGASLKIAGFAAGTAVAGPLAAMSLPACLAVAAGFEALAALLFLCLPDTRRGRNERPRRPSPERAV
ncbi:hypothetical protein BAY61_23865 [Prauserella marina]|nr:hypothetical protein BAY61_23865 [Prauserella marina]